MDFYDIFPQSVFQPTSRQNYSRESMLSKQSASLSPSWLSTTSRVPLPSYERLIVNPSLQALSTTAIVRLNLVITDNQPMLIHMLGCKRRQNFIFSNKVLYLALVVCINFEIKIFIFFISLTIFRNNFQTKNIIVSS